MMNIKLVAAQRPEDKVVVEMTASDRDALIRYIEKKGTYEGAAHGVDGSNPLPEQQVVWDLYFGLCKAR